MSNISFSNKWKAINKNFQNEDADEETLFVEKGKDPITQRQLNLFYYFLFIKNIFSNIENVNDVLEIGCGRGTLSLYLATYLRLTTSLQDVSGDAIDIAKKDFDKYNHKANFYIGDIINNTLPSDSYDAAVSIGLAEHFELKDVESLFREQHRLLRDGGVMISLNIPRKFSVQFLNEIMRFVKKIFGQYKEDIKKDYFRNSLEPIEYKKIAEKVGFKNIEITNVCPFPIYTPIKMTTDKKITKFNKFILKVKSLFQKYPYKTNYIMSQAHFLVGYKK